ncbi:hypothetical protein BBH99_18280 [Chryseobacterium contaminans]|uniref:Uncharacterized protein n=1 Tax=Chryseobacterium contaminans TaxID=1423959 RepID=A0A1M7GSI8_9FLAO|nr:hypothetical protein [Chryseobacterium contaminans]OCA79637.1 hypothetical protein BBH99_18280 [Chryseobacterium contaminans]SHM19128.1 hypothetical protein SAMN05444407_110153 [Chryseobacterium contaminans]
METKKLYEYFLDTLSHCGSFILDSSKEDIEYQIFEEFDIGIISFLHEDSLKQLLDSKLITFDVYNRCLLLRKRVLELQELDLWKIDLIKTNKKWREVIVLCDEIKYMIKKIK